MPNYSGVWTLDEVYEAVLQNEWTGMPTYFLSTWGNSAGGRLGVPENGTTVDASSPIQVGVDDNWDEVAAEAANSAAVKQDNSLWLWGLNSYGQLGIDARSSSNASSPTQVGVLTNWAHVTLPVEATVAIKVDGTLWAWGRGQNGRTGLGITGNRSSPVQVGTLSNWSTVSSRNDHCVALKTDGTLWTWGDNDQGELGDNDQGVDKLSPIQIGADTDWAYVNAGNGISFAIKTDGTLWAWGNAGAGRLGTGDSPALDRSSPVQVGALTDWSYVASANPCFAIKTDGTLWAWGIGTSGNIGDNTIISKSSPIQIGSETNWYAVATAGQGPVAVQTGRRGMS